MHVSTMEMKLITSGKSNDCGYLHFNSYIKKILYILNKLTCMHFHLEK
jgi:hypothetical protein